MKIRGLLGAVLVLLASTLALATNCKIDEFLVKKGSGTTNLQVLPSAHVYVYNPGGTTSSAGSGKTLTLYDTANFAPGDIVEVDGLAATVDTVPTGTSLVVLTDLAWSAYDRVLKTSSPVTIYYDSGGTSTITQPAHADTNGRVEFYMDCVTRNEADMKATSGTTRIVKTLGYAMLDQGIAHLAGAETFTGNKTFSGTTVLGTTTATATTVSTFHATGAATLDSTMTVGAITAASLTSSGSVSGSVLTSSSASLGAATVSSLASGGAIGGTDISATLDMNAAGGMRKLLGPFYALDIPATEATIPLAFGSSSSYLYFYAPRAGSIISISLDISGTIVSGTVSFTPKANGVSCSALIVSNPVVYSTHSTTKDSCPFAANQAVWIERTSNSLSPTTLDAEAYLEVEF